VPHPTFIVDADVRILEMNRAAEALTGKSSSTVYLGRGGEVLHCINAASAPAGCGTGQNCKSCVIRSAVQSAIRGQSVERRRMSLQVLDEKGQHAMQLLITASPIDEADQTVLLMVEDVTELSTLRGLIPMCMNCRRIRNDEQFWQSVEEYFHEAAGVDFSHGLCLECKEKMLASREED
jgi:PAS domain-containing protein